MVKPRYQTAPKVRSSRGKQAVELAESVGLQLDDWQKLALDLGLRRSRRKWAAFEVGVNVARQNGKGAIIEARELAGVFLFGEKLLIHSAHQFDTSKEAFWRMESLLGANEELSKRVRKVTLSHGEEGFQFDNGARLRYRTRTKGGGRGFSCDCLIFDEAMFLAEMAHGALLPTLSARKDPQVWYLGSAVDQLVHDHGVVWARVRERGTAGDPSLAYLEWSAHGELGDAMDMLDQTDEWLHANPALGIRITEKHIGHERRSMDSRTFAVERLGLGDWPSTELSNAVDFDKWRGLTDEASTVNEPLCLAFDVTPDRYRSAISAAGLRDDGLIHVETVEHKRGTGWVPDRIAELCDQNLVVNVTCDNASPASALVRPLENLGVEVAVTGMRDYASACGHFFDLIEQEGLRHLGGLELSAAIRNAATRPLGDSWAWSRKLSAADISPLVAATLAVWQASANLGSVYDDRGLVAV